MKKNKQHSQPKKEDQPITLGDMLNQELMAKLKNTKQELKAAEDKKIEEEEQRKREERRLREKNKSFEELLGESNLNWKDYK
ncbi:YqkE family protein [Bacillus sp. S/N-304-OC-R1]|uniref:YqkE family protein n=1 Tax=Bacillus sp. S/N-304-OC-R1 TaxID=2758034 RepID=UPI001C8D866D|nr:YqkE family protein [Bacillus sp. S/N-304-OC-R1]MBY0122510.1 YqkE family protein [Bacillus sp. S/N-304-OC-R1]